MSESIRMVPASDVRYDPLPLESDVADHYTPELTDPMSRTSSNAHASVDLPSGAAYPRFLGRIPNNEMRQSFASSTNDPSGNSVYSSVYGLNPTGQGYGGRSTPHIGGYQDDPNGSFMDASPSLTVKGGDDTGANYFPEKRNVYGTPQKKSRRKLILGGLAVLVLIIAGVVIAIYFAVIKPKNDGTSGTSSAEGGGPSTTSSSSSSSSTPAQKLAVTGGTGTTVTTDDGTTFTYENSFGGIWYFDEDDPFNNAAQAQSWSPPLNQTFKYGSDIIRGVNLGGWLVPEPFIVPSLFEKYLNQNVQVVDEWTLSEAMRADTSPGGGISQMEDHYKTFITEQDFALIAGAGLNFVRIPLPYWAIEVWEGEPFLAQTCWQYFLKAIQWARKYGIRINLDFHALPGSQNGWNHSGKLGSFNVLNGPMGYANAERALSYIRILGEFISQPQYSPVVTMFGVTNEPQGVDVGQPALAAYYYQAYTGVRLASGIGEGKGPMISMHDGFLGLSNWAGFLPNADRISLDLHPYICFGDQSAAPLNTFIDVPCSNWGGEFNASMANFGLTVAGEFSNAVNDCGLWVNGVDQGTRFEGTFTGYTNPVGDCTSYVDWQSWSADTKKDYMQFAMHSMDALQNWFFWTWKVGNSTTSGVVESPHWSYLLGLQQGWMPTDPTTANGQCNYANPWIGPLSPAQTGGQGAGQIPASATQNIPWPPATISNGGPVTLLPSYTPTAPLVTLPVPTFTALTGGSTASAGSGWQNTADTQGIMTNIAGCNYLDPWIGPTAPPSPLCTPAAKREAVPEPAVTPMVM